MAVLIFNHGGGGQGLAIRVQIGTVQPSGSTGMLWVNTATPSNHWAAAVTAPAAPATGDLWVQTDAASANVVELLRKNSARIHVARVMQYDGSSWQAVEAHYYDGTDWTQISNTFNPATDIAYTGTMTLLDDGGGHWRIRFLTSGVLTVAQSVLIDAFLVGGGGASSSGAGGAGGYTGTFGSVTLSPGTNYSIALGAGSASMASAGGQTVAFGHTVNGGGAHDNYRGGAGGSGGGGYGLNTAGGAAGYDGSNGGTTNASYPGGAGQGTTTREFAEAGGALYASGGPGMYYVDTTNLAGAAAPGGSTINQAGAANTGNGAGGNNGGNLAGGSGIVVIRDQRAA